MDLAVISKHRAPIYGFAILWVVVFHAAAINRINFTFGQDSLWLLARLVNTGNVGVDMFLFLSGVSLYFSFAKNGDISAFLKKRLLRVVPPVWILFGWFWAYLFLIKKFALSQFIPRMMLIDFFLMTNDESIWYVSLILVLYLAYPLIYSTLYSPRAKHVTVRCLVLLAFVYVAIVMFKLRNPDYYATIEIALTRIPVFIIGCYFGKLVHDKKRVPKACVVLPFIGAAVFIAALKLGVFHGAYQRFFYAFGGISFSYAVALVCEGFDRLFKGDRAKRPLYRLLAWTGSFTLELYVAHIMLNQAMKTFVPWYGNGDLGAYAIMAVCAFFLAFATSKLVALIQRKLA